MPPSSSVSSPALGRTFLIAASVLGAVGVALFGASIWAFFQGSRPIVARQATVAEQGRTPPEKIDISRLIADAPPPMEEEALSVGGGDPIAESTPESRPTLLKPVQIPGPAAEADASMPPELPAPTANQPTAVVETPTMLRPTPVPLSAFTPKTDPRYGELVEQGKLLRNNGDTAGALVKFREAVALAPGNALAIAEIAYTFEKMTLTDKAAEQWRKVLAMGEAAGVYYSAAKAKLEAAVMAAKTETLPAAASEEGPIAEGKFLALSKPRRSDDPDPASAKKFTLSVPIRAKPGVEVNVREMKVFVLFYDRLNGKEIVRTAANVSNRWGSPPADWADGRDETLEVSYDLPTPDSLGEKREYFGYIVRLYYQGELQDTLADPVALNQRFPAPFNLSE